MEAKLRRNNSSFLQSTGTIFHVEPVGFGFNTETAKDNSYMNENEAAELKDRQCIEATALEESNIFVETLTSKGVTVVKSRGSQETPDAVFPNNWFSTHSPYEGHPYRLVLYPMTCKSRRSERSEERINLIKAYCGITDQSQVLDLTYFEEQGKFLEGTGACVFDRINKTCYVGLSNRAHLEVAKVLCDYLDYKLIPFRTRDEFGNPIYHTNVMLNIGSTFAMLCDECFVNAHELDVVCTSLEMSGRAVIPITLEQVRNLCGNALELCSNTNDPENSRSIVALSTKAWDNLFDWQKEMLQAHADEVVAIPVNTIERIGGGSVRCMIGQLFK